MAVIRFSRRAAADLRDIGVYTLRTWREDQAERYLDDIESCCQTLAQNPLSAQACDDIRPGLRRMGRGRHVIFYRPTAGGILISRILHQRILLQRQPIDDDDERP